MKKIIYTLLFLFGFVSMYSQVLENKDRVLFERSSGDTVYVLQEHVSYNLATDQNGCIRKDSSVCRNLEGILIIPKDFEKQILDSCVALYGYNAGNMLFRKRFKQYCTDYLYLFQNKGMGTKIFYSHIWKKEKSYKTVFQTQKFGRQLGVSVDGEGKVSFVVDEWIAEPSIWASRISLILSFFLVCCFGYSMFKNIEPELDSRYFTRNFKHVVISLGVYLGLSIVVGVFFAWIFGTINGLHVDHEYNLGDTSISTISTLMLWTDFSFSNIWFSFSMILFAICLTIYIPRAYRSRQQYLSRFV